LWGLKPVTQYLKKKVELTLVNRDKEAKAMRYYKKESNASHQSHISEEPWSKARKHPGSLSHQLKRRAHATTTTV
jgi:hypothetical protein